MAPHQLFQRLDRDANDYISSYEVLTFIRENGAVGISESEVNELIKFFDSNEDGRLSY
jgi:Ca2+-binding EF-hand superfamily protein